MSNSNGDMRDRVFYGNTPSDGPAIIRKKHQLAPLMGGYMEISVGPVKTEMSESEAIDMAREILEHYNVKV